MPLWGKGNLAILSMEAKWRLGCNKLLSRKQRGAVCTKPSGKGEMIKKPAEGAYGKDFFWQRTEQYIGHCYNTVVFFVCLSVCFFFNQYLMRFFCYVLFYFVLFYFFSSATYSNAESLVTDHIIIVFAEQFEKCCICSAVGTDREYVEGNRGNICKKPVQRWFRG